MIEKLLAASLLAACLVALLRLMVGERRRDRLDAAFRRAWHACRSSFGRLQRRFSRKPAQPPDPAQLTEEVIRRAREGRWEGNVYKPRSFRRPKKPH